MPSPRAEMLRVGYCWTSRAVNAAQNLIDESVYKQEKMGSRPQRAILLTKGGLDPDTVQSAFRIAESSMSSRGLSRYSKFVVMGDQMMPDAALEMIDLASLPDGFDYEKDTTLGMFTIALTGAVPPRWLWPATTSGATKADAMYQHVAGLTGGPGATLQMIATALGGSERGKQHTSGKFLPPSLKMIFDFQDDEQDRSSAEIREVRSQARASDIGGKVISVRVARQQMVSDGELSEAQFAELELDDGRLPDGDDVLSLFQSPDPQIMALLLPDPDAATVEEIDAKIEDNWATLQTAPNARLKDKARQAIAALEALRGKLVVEPLEGALPPGGTLPGEAAVEGVPSIPEEAVTKEQPTIHVYMPETVPPTIHFNPQINVPKSTVVVEPRIVLPRQAPPVVNVKPTINVPKSTFAVEPRIVIPRQTAPVVNVNPTINVPGAPPAAVNFNPTINVPEQPVSFNPTINVPIAEEETIDVERDSGGFIKKIMKRRKGVK
jgi:hypothetical protein